MVSKYAVIAAHAVYSSSVIDSFHDWSTAIVVFVLQSFLVGVALVDVVTADVARASDNSCSSIRRHQRHHKSFVTRDPSHPLLSCLCRLYRP